MSIIYQEAGFLCRCFASLNEEECQTGGNEQLCKLTLDHCTSAQWSPPLPNHRALIRIRCSGAWTINYYRQTFFVFWFHVNVESLKLRFIIIFASCLTGSFGLQSSKLSILALLNDKQFQYNNWHWARTKVILRLLCSKCLVWGQWNGFFPIYILLPLDKTFHLHRVLL